MTDSTATEDPRIGTVIAGCRIESRCRPGGMSVVYLATHEHLDRKVALKLLDPSLARDEDYRKRFLRESRLAAALYHPNIVPIYDAGEADGMPYLMMHFVRGTDLAVMIDEEGALDPDRTVGIISQVVSALDTAHDRGLVHRDVKPANILIASGEGAEPAGHVYLTDFGLAKEVQSGSRLTRAGVFMGTLDYVAPEQVQGEGIDRRADVYSLGALVYQCLTGRVPFPRDSEYALMYAHIQQEPPKVTDERPELPAAVDDVIAKTMAKDPEGRYATCGEFIESLKEALASRTAAPAATSAPAPAAEQPSAPTDLATPAEPLAPAQPAPVGGPPAPEPEAGPMAPPLVDVLSMDYRGNRYGLGRTATGYAIWDLETGGRAIRMFPPSDMAWNVAWQTFQELEATPREEPIPAPGSGEQEVPVSGSGPQGPLLVGVVFVDYRGTKYALGRSTDTYAIWDLEAGGYPVQSFPLEPQAWQVAWDRYQELETTPVAAATGQGEQVWEPSTRAGGAPVAAEPAALAGAVAVDYRGSGYGLGRTSDAYAIWDLAAGGNPVRTFSIDPRSWEDAWETFQDLEERLGTT
ncbi:MAG: serine/threonine-protein kinase [Actinomycetota bacterium]